MKKKSMFFSFFTSYIVLSAVCAVAFGFVFYYFSNINLSTEAKTARYGAATQSLAKIDSLMYSMNDIANHFTNSGNETGDGDIFSSRQPLTEEFIFQQLTNYEENMSVPLEIALHLRGDSEIFVNNGKIHFSEYQKSFGATADTNMSRLFSTINSRRSPTSVAIISGDGDDPNLNVAVSFVYPVPLMSTIPKASLIFTIKQNQLTDIFEDYLGVDKYNIYLIDNMMRTLYSSENIFLEEEERLELYRTKGTGVSEHRINKKDMVMTRALSETSGYSLVILMEKKDFYSYLGLFNKVLSSCIILFLALSIASALMFAIKNSRPIRNLAKSYSQGEELSKYNELDLIQRYIEDREKENTELSRLVDMQRPYVLITCITNLLKGKTDNKEELQFQCQCANISFNMTYFQVLLFMPVSRLSIPDTIQDIISVCDSINLSFCRLYSAELIAEKRVAVIVNSSISQMDEANIGLHIAGIISAELSANRKRQVSVGVGLVYDSIDNIHKSYVESAVVLNEYASGDNVVFFGNIASENIIDSHKISSTEYAILEQSLSQGDKSLAWATLDQIVEHIRLCGGSLLITQYLCFDIANMLIKTAGKIGVELSHKDMHELSLYEDLNLFTQTAKEIAENICIQSEKEKEKESSRLNAQVLNYVNQNFKDINLSLEQTADHFEFSQSYLSRFFKQATGLTFRQYVSDLRMSYIKEMLVSSDIHIKDIVMSAGYIDVASFTRKFKAEEGITPGQYRDMKKNTER